MTVAEHERALRDAQDAFRVARDGYQAATDARDTAIRAARSDGMTVTQIARITGMPEQNIYRLLRRTPRAEK